jgi:hypothetical protein
LLINSDGDAQRASQVGHIFSVSFGFNSPKLVIEVSYMKFYAQLLPPFRQDMK